MTKKSSSTTKPSKYAKPYITAAANATRDAYTANSGTIQNATDSVTSLLPSMIEKYKAGNPAVNAAQGYITDTLGSDYSQNPYLEQVLANSNNDVKNQMQASLGVKGLTGGSDYAGLIANKVAQNSLNTRYQDYDNWENRRATAAGLAPGVAAADVIQVAPMLSTLQASLTPIEAAGGYASSVAGLMSPYTKTTQTTGAGGLLGSLAGSALSGWASGGFKGL